MSKSLISVQFGTGFHSGSAKSCARYSQKKVCSAYGENEFVYPESVPDHFLVVSFKGVRGYVVFPYSLITDPRSQRWSYMGKEGDSFQLEGNCTPRQAKEAYRYITGKRFQRYYHKTMAALRGSY